MSTTISIPRWMVHHCAVIPMAFWYRIPNLWTKSSKRELPCAKRRTLRNHNVFLPTILWWEVLRRWCYWWASRICLSSKIEKILNNCSTNRVITIMAQRAHVETILSLHRIVSSNLSLMYMVLTTLAKIWHIMALQKAIIRTKSHI